MKDVVCFAKQILAMERELQSLRNQVAELEQYREKYTDLLNTSIRHGSTMMGSILDIAMVPGVMDAISLHNTTEGTKHAS
jgi:hypothetical protein